MTFPVYDFIEKDFSVSDDKDFLQTCLKRVLDFNHAAKGKHQTSDSTISFQKSLVEEEFKELIDGILKRSREEVIDALCDIFVVSTYWDFQTTLKGLSEELGFCTSTTVEDASIIISDSFLEGSAGEDSLSAYVGLMQEGITKEIPSQVVSACVDMMRQLNFNYTTALCEVLSSNESKMPLVEDFISSSSKLVDGANLQEMLKLESTAIESRSGMRYSGVSGEVINGRVVFKDENGKIMKPLTYFEPDLEGM